MKYKKIDTKAFIVIILLMIMTSFLLLSFREGSFDLFSFVFGSVFALYIYLEYYILKKIFPELDRFALLSVQFLVTVGVIVLYRMDKDTAVKQFAVFSVSNIIMILTMLIVRKTSFIEVMIPLFMVLSLGLLVLPALFGRSIGGAKNWISIAGFSFQPSEFVKVLFILISAGYLKKYSDLKHLIPYFLFTALCVLILMYERDLGAALLLCAVFLILYLVSTGNIALTLAFTLCLAAGAYVCVKLFPHVQTRIDIWRDPWSRYQGEGYQIVQGLIALASGGLTGTGIGLGLPSAIPASKTDYIFAVIGEEFGIIFGICLIMIYVIIVIRGILAAINADDLFDSITVFGCCSMLAFQSFIIISGVIKLLPLTGITLPFVSYGGTSLITSMIMLGVIEGIAVKNGEKEQIKLEDFQDMII